MANDAEMSPAMENEVHLCPKDHSLNKRLVGELLYLEICTISDISFAMFSLTRRVDAPNIQKFQMVRRVLPYLPSTRRIGIV